MASTPYGRQDINEHDVEAVCAALRSDYLTQGPIVPEFEHALSSICGSNHAVAVNSATSALHVACLALGVGPGDMVWTSPISFVASANCALYCGATVDFVDIDPRTYNLRVSALEEKLQLAQSAGRLPKLLIAVHMCGQACDMRDIFTLSQKYGFKVIEDASHAIGGRYLGSPIGDCRYSDVTIFSFHPVKIITTGEGGAALTNDPGLAATMARLRSHGVTREPSDMQGNTISQPWYYQQIELGFNYRMTELQAALGLSQLNRLKTFVDRRHTLADYYDSLLVDLPARTPWRNPDCFSSFHLYVLRIPLENNGPDRDTIYWRLRRASITANLHYIPIYRHPYYARKGYRPKEFPESESYFAEAITLPLYPGLTHEEQARVVQEMRLNERQTENEVISL